MSNVPSVQTKGTSFLKAKKGLVITAIAIVMGILTLVTPMLSATFTVTTSYSYSYPILTSFGIWGNFNPTYGPYAYAPMNLLNAPWGAFQPGIQALPVGGVVALIGIILLAISVVPARRLENKTPFLAIAGGILALLGPILFLATFASALNDITISVGYMLGDVGSTFSFSSLTLGFGAVAGFISGALGIVAGVLSKKPKESSVP